MTISLNPSVQHSYPGVIPPSMERVRDAHSFTGLGNDENGFSTAKTRRVERITSVTEQTTSQQKYRFQQFKLDASDSNVAQPATNAQVLSHMIDKMGGSGVFAGPGQLFNILV